MQEQMKVDLTQPILGFDGKPVINQAGEPIEIGTIIRNILGAPIQKESGGQKLKRYQTGIKCVSDTVDLDEDDRSLIKELIKEEDMGISPVVYGRILEAISDPKD